MSHHAMEWALERTEAEHSDLLVLVVLGRHANTKGRNAWPAIKTICRESRLSKSAVYESLANLLKQGLIEKTGTHKSGTTIYRLDMPEHRVPDRVRTSRGRLSAV